jgi:hypothetical protein
VRISARSVVALVVVLAVAAWLGLRDRGQTADARISPTPPAQPESVRVAPTPKPAPRRRAEDETPPPTRRFAEDVDAPPPTPTADAFGSAARASDRRRVEVLVVDGSTGAALPDAPVRRGDEHGPPAAGSKLSIGAYDQAEIEFHVDWPDGFGGLDTVSWRGPVASRATSVRFVLPAFPLGDVAVRFVDEAGVPVSGVAEISATARDPYNGHIEAVTLHAPPSDADGSTSLRLPRIPFQVFVVDASRRIVGDLEHGLGATIFVRPSEFGAARRDVVLVVRTPDGPGQSFGSGIGCGPDHEPAGPKALLVVRLFHGDEKPAVRVTVRLDDGSYLNAKSGDDGVARFDALTKGDRKFVASAHGFRPTPFHAQVGKDAEIIVRESPSRTIEVIVADADDRRLPAACVTSRCASVVGADGTQTYVGGWCSVAQLDGDVELATPLTGADGTLRLQEPAGEIEYRAQLGGAAASVTSAADVVRIVLTKR